MIDELFRYLDTDTTWYVVRHRRRPRLSPFPLSTSLPVLRSIWVRLDVDADSSITLTWLLFLWISFPTDKPSTAVTLQKAHWEPLHAHFKAEYGVDIVSYEDLVLGPGKKFEQKRETKEVLRRVVERWDGWEIAG